MRTQDELPRGVAGFDQLPDQALVSVKAYAWLEGIAEVTAWRRIRRGTVAAIRLDGCTRIAAGEIRASRSRATTTVRAAA